MSCDHLPRCALPPGGRHGACSWNRRGFPLHLQELGDICWAAATFRAARACSSILLNFHAESRQSSPAGTQLRRRHDEWTETISLPRLKVDDNQDKCLLLIPHHCQKFGDVAFSLTAADKVTREQERINGSFIMFCP